MGTKSRLEITIESRQRTIIRSRLRPLAVWCQKCAAAVRVLTPDQAAALTRTTARAVYRRIEAGELHFTETEEGGLLVCLSSILQ